MAPSTAELRTVEAEREAAVCRSSKLAQPVSGLRADLYVRGGLVLTCVSRGGDLIGRIPDGAIAIAGDQIVAVGTRTEVERSVDLTAAECVDAQGCVVAPGFVDSHTHLVFGGSRVQEYAARMTHTAAEVRGMGIPSGILATVSMTRAASVDELFESARARLDGMFWSGTTTVEAKSGYGLNTAEELRMLEVGRMLDRAGPIDVINTFLGAHDFPPDTPRERYIDSILDEMIPEVAARGLAEFCDVYLDDGYYTVAESRRILARAHDAGMRLKVHTDAYSDIGGAFLAAEMGVVSADHLNYTTPPAARALASRGVIGVVMPALDWAVAHKRPFDARMLMAEGVTLALATDLCPGCWAESMQFVMQLACRLYRFSPEEALLAATTGGARSLGLADRGTIAVGQVADLQIWRLPTFEDVMYRLGNNAVERMIKRGRVVARDQRRFS